MVIILAAWLCLAAQTLIALPHHHHGAQEAPCFNAAHCAGLLFGHYTENHDDCECAHSHCAPEAEPAAGDDCSLRVDVPVISDNRPTITVPVILFPDLFAPCALSGAGDIDITVSFAPTAGRLSPPGPGICVVYLAEAHAARAPSFS